MKPVLTNFPRAWLLALAGVCLSGVAGCTMVQYPAMRTLSASTGPAVERVPRAAREMLATEADADKIAALASRGDGWRWIDGREGQTPAADGSSQVVVQTYFSRVSVVRAEKGRRGVVEEIIPARRRANRPRFPGWLGGLPDDATLLYTAVSPSLADRFGPRGRFESRRNTGPDAETLLNLPTETLVLWAYGPRENAKGIVVWLHSAGGTAYEATICKRLVKMGWWVLQSEFPWPLRRSHVYLMTSDTDESFRNVAQQVASEVDERLMIVSDAVNTSLALLEGSRGLQGLPRVVVGSSLGGFTAPAACAGLDRPPAAAVFIDTGSDMIDLFHHSPLPNAGVYFNMLNILANPDDPDNLRITGRPLTDPERARLTTDFEEASALCSPRLLPALASTPVLMVTANQDEVVRRPSRRRLWELLGRPERWELDVGHELLVYLLPNWGQTIARWIDTHARPSEGESRPR